MKWFKLQRRLRQRQVKWLVEKIREAEMEVSICGLEQGEIMGEEDNKKDLIDYWNSSEQFEDMLKREADEAMNPCIFKYHGLYVLQDVLEMMDSLVKLSER